MDLQASDVTLPIRVLHLPMAFDERGVKGAVQRYMKSVRPEAPYLPSNVDFVAANNGLKGEEASSTHSQQPCCSFATCLSRREAGSTCRRFCLEVKRRLLPASPAVHSLLSCVANGIGQTCKAATLGPSCVQVAQTKCARCCLRQPTVCWAWGTCT